jgi:hypothetical protein
MTRKNNVRIVLQTIINELLKEFFVDDITSEEAHKNVFLRDMIDKFLIYKEYTISSREHDLHPIGIGSVEDLDFLLEIKETDKYDNDFHHLFELINSDNSNRNMIFEYARRKALDNPVFEDFECNTFKYTCLIREIKMRGNHHLPSITTENHPEKQTKNDVITY